jgi:WD40 repeat protein
VSRPRGEPLRGHTGEVMAVALGEVDGEPVVVSGSGEKLWHEGFDALARALRGISDDNTVRLWDARTGRPRGGPLTGHTAPVIAVAVGEVGGAPVVVSGSVDCTVRLWDAHSHSLLRIVPLRSEVTGLAMGKDSAIAVSAHNGLLVLDF